MDRFIFSVLCLLLSQYILAQDNEELLTGRLPKKTMTVCQVDSLYTDSSLYDMSKEEIEAMLLATSGWFFHDSEYSMVLEFHDTTRQGDKVFYGDLCYWYLSDQKDSSFYRSGNISGSDHMNWEVKMPYMLVFKDHYRMPDRGNHYKILTLKPNVLIVRWMPDYGRYIRRAKN